MTITDNDLTAVCTLAICLLAGCWAVFFGSR